MIPPHSPSRMNSSSNPNQRRSKPASSGVSQTKGKSREESIRSGYICDLKLQNDLPEVPVEPRFLNIPFDNAGVTEFIPESSLYTDYKWPVHFSLRQMDIPLIGYDKYSRLHPEKKVMDPEDEILFQDIEEDSEQAQPASGGSWLRYMEYGDVSVQTKPSTHSIPQSTASGMEETPTVDETKRIERIEHSFTHNTPTHKNKNVVAEAVWEVLPDEICCCFDYGLVHFEGTDIGDEKEVTSSTLRLHKMGGTQYSEQLTPVEEDEEEEKLEWKRSYVAASVRPIQKEAAKEYIVLEWDPTSSGGVASFFQLSDDHVVSLIGHKPTRKNHNIKIEIDKTPARESDVYEMYNVPDED